MSRKSFCNLISLAAAFLVGVIAFTPSLAAAKDRPFKARLTGNASLSPTGDPAVIRNDETGEGHATHLGRFRWKSVELVDFSAFPPAVAVVGSFVMTAANGDQVFGTYETIGAVDETGNLIIHGSYVIDGGTGRFEDATGSGDLDAVASLGPGLPFEGTLNGVIDY